MLLDRHRLGLSRAVELKCSLRSACRALKTNEAEKVNIAVAQRDAALLFGQCHQLRRPAHVRRHQVGEGLPTTESERVLICILDAAAERSPPSDQKTPRLVRCLRSGVLASTLRDIRSAFIRCSLISRKTLDNAVLKQTVTLGRYPQGEITTKSSISLRFV